MTASPLPAQSNLYGAIESICRCHPHVAPILKPLSALLSTEELLSTAMLAPTTVTVNPGRLAQGAPVLVGIPLDFLEDHLQQALKAMLPVIAASFPQIEALAKVCDPREWKDREVASAVQLYLQGDEPGLTNLAESWGLDSGLLRVLLELIQRPVLRRLATEMRDAVPASLWVRGHCPLCGQAPAMSYLSKSQGDTSEFLQGGGGQKILSCGLCCFEWRVSRTTCTACGSVDPKNSECLRTEGRPEERVDACKACGNYCPVLDLRELEKQPHPRLAPLTYIHLDLLAQDRGFHPQAWTIWNTFDQDEV